LENDILVARSDDGSDKEYAEVYKWIKGGAKYDPSLSAEATNQSATNAFERLRKAKHAGGVAPDVSMNG